MKYDSADQPLFTEISRSSHREEVAGRVWMCVNEECDGVHHYYVAV